MPTDTEVFRKIKEISTRSVSPRPIVDTRNLALELGMSRDAIMPCLMQLKNLKLVNFNDTQGNGIKLTLLGTVVKR